MPKCRTLSSTLSVARPNTPGAGRPQMQFTDRRRALADFGDLMARRIRQIR
jgi:hypothetical protein